MRLVPPVGAEQVKPERKGKKMVPMHPYIGCQLAAERRANMLAWARQEHMVRQAREARRATAGSAPRLSRALRLAA
jgi:hypothetical protein